MASDRHQMAPVGHGVAENGQVPVIHIRTIERYDSTEFIQQSFPHSLDAQHLNDLAQVITCRPGRIHILVSQHSQQIDTFCIQRPFLVCLYSFNYVKSINVY